MEIVQNIRSMRITRKGGNLNVFRAVITMVQPNMANESEEDNPDWNRFWSYDPSPEDPHEFGECMENQHDEEWSNEQEGMDRRRKMEEWERLKEEN